MLSKKKENKLNEVKSLKNDGKLSNKPLIWGWIIFYAIITLIAWSKGEKLVDYATYILILVLVVLTCKKIKIPSISIWFFGLSTLWHAMGVFPFRINGEVVSLYALFGNYDIIGHFTGFLLFTIGFLSLYYANHTTISKLNAIILLFAIIGVGALIEISEYLGFRFFGIGEGWLKFGEGDNSANFGPWGDSMEDIIMNILGILTGFAFYILLNHKRQSHRIPPYKKLSNNIIKNLLFVRTWLISSTINLFT